MPEVPLASRGRRWVTAPAALAGWPLAGRVYRDAFDARADPPPLDLVVTDLSDGRVTLRPTEPAGAPERPGIWGLEGRDVYARVTSVIGEASHEVTRAYEPWRGELHVGDAVRLDNFAFPDDPAVALARPASDVAVPGPDGPLPAWRFDGPAPTWLLCVHGKGSHRAEALRLLSSPATNRFPALAISYRNDPAAPRRDGRYQYGLTEWADLHAAVEYALAEGARDVVLVGYSMGAAIVANFLAHSSLAHAVRGLILEAPMLNFTAVLEYAARRRRLPRPLMLATRHALRWRYGIDCHALAFTDALRARTLPTLLFHGDADPLVPVAASDELARILPGVTYHRVPDAHHVGAWNLDPAAYDAAVARFLSELCAP